MKYNIYQQVSIEHTVCFLPSPHHIFLLLLFSILLPYSKHPASINYNIQRFYVNLETFKSIQGHPKRLNDWYWLCILILVPPLNFQSMVFVCLRWWVSSPYVVNTPPMEKNSEIPHDRVDSLAIGKKINSMHEDGSLLQLPYSPAQCESM